MVDDLVSIDRNVATSPVLVLAPHGGRVVPVEHRGAFLLSPEALDREHDLMVDHHTDLLARLVGQQSGATTVVNALSRFVVDVERFPDDREEMNTVGMGVLYTHGSQRQLMRDESLIDRTSLMEFFADYSHKVTELVREILHHHDSCLILDLHSFPSSPLPYELHQEESRPELCLGHEEPHAPLEFLTRLRQDLAGWDLADNEPFHGSYVPLEFFGSDPRVQSVMLEIRRDTYLTEPAGDLFTGRLEALATFISRALTFD
jgi:N-formylglutamate amidohydrolase